MNRTLNFLIQKGVSGSPLLVSKDALRSTKQGCSLSKPWNQRILYNTVLNTELMVFLWLFSADFLWWPLFLFFSMHLDRL